MTLLKSFLGCGTLRTGTLVAGFGGIILSIVGILLVILTDVEIKTIVLDWIDKDVVKIIIIFNFAMSILISILLIVGVIKRNMYLMVPWVLLGLLLAIGLLVSVLYTGIKFLIDGDTLSGTLCLVVGLIGVVIYIYMWMVAYSFFCIIREETNRGAYMKDPFRRRY